MTELSAQTSRLRLCIERLQAGDAVARDDLITCACDQLRRLTRGLLRDYPRVGRWEQTDEVLQNAYLRLWQALQDVTPARCPSSSAWPPCMSAVNWSTWPASSMAPRVSARSTPQAVWARWSWPGTRS